MNNKRVVGVLVLFFFLVISAYAKQKQEPQQQMTADEIVAKMTTQLQLTDQQALQVKPIIENYLAQQQQIKLDEKKQLSKVLNGQQMFTWDFLQNENTRDKKKKTTSLF